MAESRGILEGTSRCSLRKEVRIVLIGKTGCGKSATGNSLLGRDVFESKIAGSSVTSKCQFARGFHKNKNIVVLDTPGMFDTNVSNNATSTEVMKCIAITSPGIHAVVLVTRIGRFTQEEQKTVELFKENFGEGVKRFMIIVFTGKDDLVRGQQSLEAFVEGSPKHLQDLVAECGNRILAVDNTATQGREKFRDELLKMIDDMVKKNGGGCYTSEKYEKAEELMLQRQRQIMVFLELQERTKKRELMEENDTLTDTLKQKDEEMLKVRRELQAYVDKEMTAVETNPDSDDEDYDEFDDEEETVYKPPYENVNPRDGPYYNVYPRDGPNYNVYPREGIYHNVNPREGPYYNVNPRGGPYYNVNPREIPYYESEEGIEERARTLARKEMEIKHGLFAFFKRSLKKFKKLLLRKE